MVITDRSSTSKYKVQVILSACVHGFLDAAQTKPASLILVDYKLNTTGATVFSSIDTSFSFRPYPVANDSAKLAPHIAAYAPFVEPVPFNRTTVKKSSKHIPSVKVNPQVAGTGVGEVGYAHESGSEHDQKYFDLGQGGRDYDDRERGYRVWWNVVQNRSQSAGIPPVLRLAMLVERDAAAPADKFQAMFSIAPRGGIGYSIDYLKEKFLRKTTYDDPVIFDPAADPKLGDLEDELVAAGVLKWVEDAPPAGQAPGTTGAILADPNPAPTSAPAAAPGHLGPMPVVVRKEDNKSLTVQPFEKLRKRERLEALSYVWGLAATSTDVGTSTK